MEKKYVVKINGKVSSAPLSKLLAEQFIKSLILEQQMASELVSVDDSGKEMLFG